MHSPWQILLVFAVVFAVSLYASITLLGVVRRLGGGRFRAILDANLDAHRRGNYLAQLNIIQGLRNGEEEPPDYLFFRGAALLQLGRLAEAERVLRRSLAGQRDSKLKVICRSELGRVLMEQERWDEAEACFRQATREAPQRGGGPRALAELLLRHDGQAAVALEAAGAALTLERRQGVSGGDLGKESHAYNLGESLAFYAWALAKNHGQAAEIDGILKDAFRICGSNAKPIVTELHFCAGHAYALVGNSAESSQHFQTGAEIDTEGLYGRLCHAAQEAIRH